MFDILRGLISNIESAGADFVEARFDELLIRTIVKENRRVTSDFVSGDFSIAAPSSYKVECGEITKPVEVITVAFGQTLRSF